MNKGPYQFVLDANGKQRFFNRYNIGRGEVMEFWSRGAHNEYPSGMQTFCFDVMLKLPWIVQGRSYFILNYQGIEMLFQSVGVRSNANFIRGDLSPTHPLYEFVGFV